MTGQDAPAIRRIEESIKGLRRELTLTWAAHEREHEQHDKAHSREHDFAQKAIDTAAELAKSNKADSNEWRSAMTDREARFATHEDMKAVFTRLDSIEDRNLVVDERDRQRIMDDAEDKRQSERRQARAQWTIAVVVGFIATFGAVLVNLILRLAGA